MEEDKGELLFEEKESLSLKTKTIEKLFGATLIAFSLVLTLLLSFFFELDLVKTRELSQAFLITLLIVILVFLLGVAEIVSSARIRVLRVYQNGIALPYVAFKDAFKERENILPFTKINTVVIEEIRDKKRIALYCEHDRKEIIDYEVLSNPLAFMRALKDTIPKKMDERFDDYLERAEDVKGEKTKALSLATGYGIEISLIAIVLFLFIFFGSAINPRGTLLENIFAFIIIAISAFFLWAVVVFESKLQYNLFRHHSHLQVNRIVLKHTWLSKTFKVTRDEIKVSEIKYLERRLDPLHYENYCAVKLTNGALIEIDYEIFKMFLRSPYFELKKDRLVNKNPVKDLRPVSELRIERLLPFTFLGTILFLLIGSGFGKPSIILWREYSVYIASIIVVIGVVLVLYQIRFLRR